MVEQWLTVIGVIGVTVFGVLLGLGSSKLKGRWWVTGFVVGMGLVGVVVLGRRVPVLLPYAPFSWMMRGRVEYVAMGVAATMGMSALLPRVRQVRLRRLVGIFMLLAALRHAVLPFAYPLFIREQWENQETVLNNNKYCQQSADYSCGPAAAVSALVYLGVPAEEGDLVVGAYTSPMAGTDADLLAEAINRMYGDEGVEAAPGYFRSVEDLEGAGVVVALMKYNFWVDHFVAVLGAADDEVVYVDPIYGQMFRDSYEEFGRGWRRCGVVISRK